MKNIFVAVFFSLLFWSCSRVQIPQAVYDEGVSHELAGFRKQNYKDVRYDLFFNLPKQVDDAVKGVVSVSYMTDAALPLILDFRAPAQAVDSVLLNGSVAEHKFENEHIVLADVPQGENVVTIHFTSPDKSLNRRKNLLYTLLVPDRARTVFPCFEQPGLKALYSLSLELPSEWEAVANGRQVSRVEKDSRAYVEFSQTEPLSTYLFSFVAGEMKKGEFARGERKINIYHRETDVKKVAQCEEIADEVFDSLEWLEEYTGIPYPFAKYDLIILPGFQYGGMEHTGATLYNDTRMFLNENPTLNERLQRSSLIAHETAHMWFGDFVTMDWFNDVWTKEVFANYFASRMVEPLFTQVNHRLNFIMDYLPYAYSEDRTPGANPVKQELDNLRNAGLVYGNIIYDKSPVIMEMLVRTLGEEAFRKGIREYLTTFAYGNATWDDLVGILDSHTDQDLRSWSNSWVNEKGMPCVTASVQDGELVLTQEDVWGRGISWPQELKYEVGGREVAVTFAVGRNQARARLPESLTGPVIPDVDGRGYGYFKLDAAGIEAVWDRLAAIQDDDYGHEVMRGAMLINLYENLRRDNHDPLVFLDRMLEYLSRERNPLLFSRALAYVGDCVHLYLRNDRAAVVKAEKTLMNIVEGNPEDSFRLQAFRLYRDVAATEEAVAVLYDIWDSCKAPKGCSLSESDYISLSYVLALHLPEKAERITARQLSRIKNPDRADEYRFISPAVSPSAQVRDSVFNSLLDASNRRVEPWASTALSYLNHKLRASESVKYIRPGLDAMRDVQRTGDIFFPSSWARALLKGHEPSCTDAEIESFFTDNPDYPVMLGNKIKHQMSGSM